MVKETGLTLKGARSEFFARFNAVATEYQNLCTTIKSTGDSEKYRWLGSVPNMREMGSGRQAKGLRAEAYDVANLKYESTLEVDRDELSDDQTGQIRLRINDLAVRAATHKDYLLAQLLANGSTSGYNSYDGVSFFNDAHVSGASGNQDNKLTYNASDHTAVTAAEFRASALAACAAMMAFKDDQGEPAFLGPQSLVAILPPQLWAAGTEGLQASILANTTNVFAGLARPVMFPWLTDGTKWFLCNTGGVVRPFMFQDREPIEFGSLEQDSEAGFTREKYLYGVRARYRVTYGMWQQAVETTFN